MGGGQANKGQATASFNTSQAASAQDLALSKQNQAYQQQAHDALFGKPGGSGGSLTSFMDPASLTASKLSAPYQTQFNQASDTMGRDYANQRGSLAQSWVNRGATGSGVPSGFQADQERKLGSEQADARGSTYANLAGQQHQDALSNFWNANNIYSGNAATSQSGALAGSGQAGSTANGIYGVAGQWHPSQAMGLVGAALGAGGSIAGGALAGRK